MPGPEYLDWSENDASVPEGIDPSRLPKLDYKIARITIMDPAEVEIRGWAAVHDGGFLARSLDSQQNYGFLPQERVKILQGPSGEWWELMRRKAPGTLL